MTHMTDHDAKKHKSSKNKIAKNHQSCLATKYLYATVTPINSANSAPLNDKRDAVTPTTPDLHISQQIFIPRRIHTDCHALNKYRLPYSRRKCLSPPYRNL